MAALDNIASELLKSANEADSIFKKTRDQAQRDKSVRLRRIVENLRNITLGASDLNGLSDVAISSPTNAQVLSYNSTTLKWQNTTISTATPTLAQVTTAGNTTTNAITVGGLTSNGNVNVGSNFVGNGTLQYVHFTGGSGEFRFKNGSGGGWYYTWCQNGSTGLEERMRLSSGNNLLIGTTTDAGYRLDVVGTGRFSSTLTIATAATDASPSNSILITTANSGNGGRISWGDSNTSILRYSNSLYFREYTGNFRFESTGSGAALVYISSVSTSVLSGKFITSGSTTAASALAQGVYFNNTLVAAANNDVLVGLDINPTFTNGAFTGVSNIGLRVSGQVLFNAYGAYNTVTPTLRIENVDTNNVAIQIKGNVANYKYYWIYDSQTTEGIYKSDQARIDFYGGTNVGFSFRNNYGRLFTIVGTTGNVLINTTTDAGYKLDVVGADSRFNGVRVGLGAGGVSTNTVVGNGALALNTTGDNLIAIGSALVKNTTGVQNIGIGNLSLRENTTGSYNTAIGYWAGFAISTGSQNTLLGRYAGNGIATGSSNVAIGMNSLYNSATAPNNNVSIGTTAMQNGSGDNNIAIGTGVLYNNTASNNTAVGYQAGLSNTTGTLNTLIGHSAGYNNTTAVGTTAVGHRSLYTNSTGSENTGVGEYALQANSTGNQNVSVGAQSMFLNNTGSDNTAVGFRALQLVTSSNNTAVGSDSLQNTTTGGNNVSVGRQSLLSNSTGNYNIALGFQAGYAGVANTTGSNNIFIGYQATGVSATDSNRTWIGNSSTTSTWVGGNLLVGTTTDAGYKLDVNGTGRFTNNLSIIKSYNLTWGTNQQINVTDYPSYFSGGYNLMSFISTSSGSYADDGSFVWRNAGTSSNLMVLTGVGNLGLGTSNPTDKIHIVDNTNGNKFGRISAGGTDASAAWVAQNDQVDNVVYRVFGSAVTGSQMGISLARSASLMANLGGSGKFLVGTYSSTDFVMGTGNQERMRLVDSTGNFLIGTMTDSGHRLNVSGTANVSGNLTVGGIVDTAATYTNCALLSSINVGTNSTAIISFTPKQDPNGWWNAGTKKWTPTIAGYYYVALQVRWDIGTLGNQINIQILKNTSTQAIAQDLLPTNTGLTQTTNCIVYMNGSTDYLEFSGFTSSTTGEFLFGEATGTWTFFNAFRIN